MGPNMMIFFKLFPIVSFVFTCWVIATVYSIQGEFSLGFYFIAFQFFANWILVLYANNPWRKDHTKSFPREAITSHQIWYCSKCERDYPYSVQHCPLCRKCWAYRDHHCFFLGTCVSRNNMKYFIIFLMYTVVACGYISSILVPHLTREFQAASELSNWELTARFLYPMMLVRWLLRVESLHNVAMSTMFGVVVSVGVTVFFYGAYQCYRVASGAAYKNEGTAAGRNLPAIFGRAGFLNILLPIPTRQAAELSAHLPVHQS